MLRFKTFSRALLPFLGLSTLGLAGQGLGCTPPATAPAPLAPAGEAPSLAATLVLEGANVVVLDPEPHIERDRSIVADGDRIVWVGPRAERPPTGNATVVDVTGRFVMSGLSDMHAHLPAEDDTPFGLQRYLDLQLAAGVTSVRSMRGDPSHAAVRAAIVDGTRAGPDLLLASNPVATESLSAAEAQQAVAEAQRDDADFIKLLGVGDLQSYRNLMAAAGAANLGVAGHLPPSVTAEVVAELGQTSIEHLGGVLDAVRTDPDGASAVAGAFAQPSVFHCPTLHWYALGLGVYTPQDFDGAEALAAVPAATREAWDTAFAERRAKLGGESAGRRLTPIADRLEALRLLHEAGARLVVGPDSGGAYGLPGSAVHEEMRLFAEAGVPAADILRAATTHPAALRGAADEGAVAVGHIANLAVLSADPLADIGNIATVRVTVHRGQVAWRNDDASER